MKRKLKKIGIVLLGIALTVITVIEVTYIHRGYTRLMGFYGLKRDSVDLVVVGTSITFCSYMPMDAWEKYGVASCVYGTNVQLENVLKYSLKDVLRTQSPQLILVDISPFMRGHYVSNTEWTKDWRKFFISYNLDSRNYTLDRFKLVKELNSEIGGDFRSYWTYFWDITRCHTHKPVFAQFNNTLNDPARGYYYHERNAGGAVDLSKLVYDDGSVSPLSPLEQGYFDELVETVKGLGTEVVFYSPPVYFDAKTEYGIKNHIAAQLEKEGLPFLDLSGKTDEIGLKYDEDFWSLDHHDALGAEKVTAYLADYLHANYDLPDRREDPAYAGWHADHETWLGMKAQYLEQDRTGVALVTSGEAMPGM